MGKDELRGYLPTSFGGVGGDFDLERQMENARRLVGSNREASKKKLQPKDDDDEDGDDDENESDSETSDDDEEFPVSHEIVFKTHDRPVTTITLDSAGARMVTGSTDCTLKFHDFASMAPNTIRAFKSVDPTAIKSSANSETHPVHVVKFNPQAASQMLVISATPQAKILSRDGETEFETPKGDMYLRDMNMTKGHVSEVTSGTWHPSDSNLFVTGGTDSSLRIWDQNVRVRQKEVIVHKSKQAGSAGRSRITAVAWGSAIESGNSLLVSAALDGSLLLWAGNGPYSRPTAEIRDAHKADTWTGGIDISSDGRLVVTRGGDDTIKLWDTRKFKQPINTTTHMSTSAQFPTTNIVFAPHASAVITGSETGDLHILNPATLRPELVTPVTPNSTLIAVQWQPKLNQIITGSANAEVHVLFDPRTSSKGALTVMSKLPKRRHIDDDPTITTDYDSLGVSGDGVATPGTASYASRHPTIGLTASGKSRDPRRPHIPVATPFAKSQPDEKHIRERIPLSSMREEDPREALLKYADKAEKDPLFTKAWATTQPKTVYADLSDEDENPKKKQKT